jgi:hypothetical protein
MFDVQRLLAIVGGWADMLKAGGAARRHIKEPERLAVQVALAKVRRVAVACIKQWSKGLAGPILGYV